MSDEITTEATLPDNKEEVIEYLKEPDEAPIEIEADEPVEEPEPEIELKEIEEELNEKEPDEEELELMTPVPRREILKKYPTLFKDFPQLEKSYYRDKQFTELLPTISDAKEAVAKAETLDKFEVDLMAGNTEEVLATVKRADTRAFHKIVDNYLPTLHKVDPQAYNHVVGNVFKMLVSGMVQEARNTNNDALQTAAQLAHQFVFGNSTYTPPSNLSKPEEKNPEADNLKAEREKFANERFKSVQTELTNKTQNTLKATIASNMDPKDNMTEYVRGKAVQDALSNLQDLVFQDKSFVSINNKLWERAFRSNFAQADVDKIRAAFLSKAKTLLPTVIKKARNEALKGTGKRISDDGPKNGPIAVGKPSTSKAVKASDIPKGMRTLDFLMQD